jgi:hypothetical protein
MSKCPQHCNFVTSTPITINALNDEQSSVGVADVGEFRLTMNGQLGQLPATMIRTGKVEGRKCNESYLRMMASRRVPCCSLLSASSHWAKGIRCLGCMQLKGTSNRWEQYPAIDR